MKTFFINFKAFLSSIYSDTQVRIAKKLSEKGLQISVAESCTGGLISSRLTDVEGSSAFVKANFVSYSNQAKIDLLGVSSKILDKYGAVSFECAYEMAKGLVEKTQCDVALVTTGIASAIKNSTEAGLIFIAVFYKDKIIVEKLELNRYFNRKNMKFMFSEQALRLVDKLLCD
ncbi:MAG: CinA family protein [Candidatus Gastranaerophilales bacterium]